MTIVERQAALKFVTERRDAILKLLHGQHSADDVARISAKLTAAFDDLDAIDLRNEETGAVVLAMYYVADCLCAELVVPAPNNGALPQ